MHLSEIASRREDLFTEKELCDVLKKSKAWAQRHRWTGTGVPYTKVGRSVFYRGADIIAWVDGNRVATTAA